MKLPSRNQADWNGIRNDEFSRILSSLERSSDSGDSRRIVYFAMIIRWVSAKEPASRQ
jgi:hypothetical protein